MELLACSGSHGFLGQALMKRLELPGREVLRLDRSGKVPKVDVVFDLAAYGNMAGHVGDPELIYEANLQRIVRTLKEIKGRKTKLIYMSTSSVTLPKQTFYSASKKAAEELIKLAVHEWGVRVAIARPYTVVGRGEQSAHLLPVLINSCIYGDEMPFVERPVHDYIDVEDVVDALVIISKKAKFEGEVYEIGTGKQLTNRKVKEIVEKTLKAKANVRIVKSVRKYDTTKWRANPRKLMALGWKPKRSIQETISSMIGDYLPM